MKTLMILMVIMLLGLTTQAKAHENYVVIEQPTNVRSGIGKNYTVRAVVDSGILTVTGKSDSNAESICSGVYQHDRNMWLQVDVEGIEGWLNYCTVNFIGSLDDIPITEPISPLIRRPTRHLYYGVASSKRLDVLGEQPSETIFISQTRVDHINLRSQPTIESEIIEILTSDQVYVIGRNLDATWSMVTYSGISPFDRETWWQSDQIQIGWVVSFLLRLPENWEEIVPVVSD